MSKEATDLVRAMSAITQAMRNMADVVDLLYAYSSRYLQEDELMEVAEKIAGIVKEVRVS